MVSFLSLPSLPLSSFLQYRPNVTLIFSTIFSFLCFFLLLKPPTVFAYSLRGCLGVRSPLYSAVTILTVSTRLKARGAP